MFDDTSAETKADENTCEKKDDSCGSDSRVQALAKAQTFAQVSRKERTYYSFGNIGADSRSRCFNMLQKNGATHVGYECSWQNRARVEDHPDGHPHQIGINPGNGKLFPSHHNCPHIHAYNSKGEEATFSYKKGW